VTTKVILSLSKSIYLFPKRFGYNFILSQNVLEVKFLLLKSLFTRMDQNKQVKKKPFYIPNSLKSGTENADAGCFSKKSVCSNRIVPRFISFPLTLQTNCAKTSSSFSIHSGPVAS